MEIDKYNFGYVQDRTYQGVIHEDPYSGFHGITLLFIMTPSPHPHVSTPMLHSFLWKRIHDI